jgi:excisionase family DNA binding protein
MEISTLPALLKLSGVMERTGLSRASVYRVINAGQLKTVKIGRSVRVREEDLVAFMDALATA